MARSSASSSSEHGARAAQLVLEVTTAVLLGLVSVATAVGAYQAGVWGQESTDLQQTAQEARDRNLSLFLERDLSSGDDSQRLFDALALQAEATFYPERETDALAEQQLIIDAGSPALQSSWAEWVADGSPFSRVPLQYPQYEAFSYAEPQAYSVVSTLAEKSSDALRERSYTMTIVSVIFAVALLLLGVAGAAARLDVTAITTGGAAIAFLIGVAVVIFGVF